MCSFVRSNAFDCVDWKILFDKLEYNGIREKILKFLELYLTERRKQFLDFAGYTSTCESIEVGSATRQGFGILVVSGVHQ